MSKVSSDFPATKRIGIFVFNEFEPLDVWGFVEAFSVARFIGTNEADFTRCPFTIELISNELTTGSSSDVPQPIKSSNGPRVVPEWFRDQACEQAFDLLMIPGGEGTRFLLDPANPEAVNELLEWVRVMDKQVPMVTSVCTGAAILASAGLLDGKPATTNRQAFPWVASFGPKVLWDNVARWVDADKYVTSAGVSAGTDMAFHLVSRIAGRAVAEAAATAAEYDWQRDPYK
ncbi:MAG: DJ-1/PfpI family protein [Cellvibrionaceae bacterium]